ncbi:hypothetical protein I79_012186 [Cricetulus griseus]|uniref:Uncharacterized protein n=1 Tax=Cricetulus griseus TaxID=10029 RepID=G3HN54_CRIGR|nr:hypothetical protein I79_012186 [Cricetulus griseus]
MNVPTPFSTSASYCPRSAPARTDTNLQESRAVQCLHTGCADEDTTCLWRQLIDCSHPKSLTIPDIASSSKPRRNRDNNMEEMSAEPWMPMKAYECTKENQDVPLFSSAQPSMQQPLNYTDDGSLRQKLSSDISTLGSTSLGLQEPGTLQCVMVSRIDLKT